MPDMPDMGGSPFPLQITCEIWLAPAFRMWLAASPRVQELSFQSYLTPFDTEISGDHRMQR